MTIRTSRACVVMTALAVAVLTSVGKCGEESEEKALQAVEKLGGRITRSTKKDGNPIVAVDIARTKATDEDLKGLKEIKNLQTLILTDTAVTDEGLKELK